MVSLVRTVKHCHLLLMIHQVEPFDFEEFHWESNKPSFWPPMNCLFFSSCFPLEAINETCPDLWHFSRLLGQLDCLEELSKFETFVFWQQSLPRSPRCLPACTSTLTTWSLSAGIPFFETNSLAMSFFLSIPPTISLSFVPSLQSIVLIFSSLKHRCDSVSHAANLSTTLAPTILLPLRVNSQTPRL